MSKDIYHDTEIENGSANYNLVTDLSQKINQLKGYEVTYSNPRCGKMIINKDGYNYIVEAIPAGKGSIEDAMKQYRYIFN